MKFDIIVIGAGPAGLCFAKALAGTRLNIALIEKQPAEILAAPPYDGREIALTHLSRKLMAELGLWDLIPTQQVSLIKTAKVLNGNSPYALNFDHAEAGEENLGFMLSNHRIRKAAYTAMRDCLNIRLLSGKEVVNLGTDEDTAWLELNNGDRLQAALIVAADSRFSATRRMMGISTSMLDFGRSCIVCTMEAELPHNDTAYECFHFDRTLAVLPLNQNQVSIVITLDSEESAKVLGMSETAFSQDITRRTEGRFGAMKLSSQLYPYPLVATFAKTFHKNRFAVIGDAAVGMHPVTAHGFNLGLRGAYTLANEITAAVKRNRNFASQALLARYSRNHSRVCAPLYHGTNALVRLYTSNSHGAKFIRRGLLRLGNHIKPAKRLIMDQLTESRIRRPA